MPKGTSCHAQLPPRLLTDLQRVVYVPGMVRDDAGIKRVEGEVHIGDVIVGCCSAYTVGLLGAQFGHSQGAEP